MCYNNNIEDLEHLFLYYDYTRAMWFGLPIRMRSIELGAYIYFRLDFATPEFKFLTTGLWAIWYH